jgi:hypothetical protein
MATQLGDSSIQIPKTGLNARVIIGQKDKSFVDHLWVLFYSIRIVGAGPREHYYLDKRTGKTDISYHFETYTHPYLTELHHDWYKKVNGKN